MPAIFRKQPLILAGLLLLCASVFAPAQETGTAADTVHVLTIDGAIGPATADYIQRSLEEAADAGAYMAIIEMDTPGGLDGAMRDIIQAILDSPIPVATYVSPQGARAASAGTYISYASHVAAMAPATNLGAATPVQVGAPSAPAPDPAADGEQSDGQQDGASENGSQSGMSATEQKMINDARAYIRGLAELRGRNAEWAETAVTEAASLSANEALAENVIDIVAGDFDDLLAQMNGMEVSVRGETMALETSDKTIRNIEPDWRTEFLTVITDPNLILILGMLGIYGLIIEFYNPGFGFAGIVGAICLLLAGYGLQLLPLNYAGLGLILLGVTLIIAEALAPSFGIMGVGGIAALTIGGVILVDTEFGVYQVSLPLIAAIAIFFAVILAATLRMFMKIRHKGVVPGLDHMVGEEGESLDTFDNEGMVKIHGEIWSAKTEAALHKGDAVKVTGVDGMTLKVRPG